MAAYLDMFFLERQYLFCLMSTTQTLNRVLLLPVFTIRGLGYYLPVNCLHRMRTAFGAQVIFVIILAVHLFHLDCSAVHTPPYFMLVGVDLFIELLRRTQMRRSFLFREQLHVATALGAYWRYIFQTSAHDAVEDIE